MINVHSAHLCLYWMNFSLNIQKKKKNIDKRPESKDKIILKRSKSHGDHKTFLIKYTPFIYAKKTIIRIPKLHSTKTHLLQLYCLLKSQKVFLLFLLFILLFYFFQTKGFFGVIWIAEFTLQCSLAINWRSKMDMYHYSFNMDIIFEWQTTKI